MQSIVESQCAAIAREKNVGIVMQKMAVPAGAVDITDEVLARIDGGASGDAKIIAAPVANDKQTVIVADKAQSGDRRQPEDEEIV